MRGPGVRSFWTQLLRACQSISTETFKSVRQDGKRRSDDYGAGVAGGSFRGDGIDCAEPQTAGAAGPGTHPAADSGARRAALLPAEPLCAGDEEPLDRNLRLCLRRRRHAVLRGADRVSDARGGPARLPADDHADRMGCRPRNPHARNPADPHGRRRGHVLAGV